MSHSGDWLDNIPYMDASLPCFTSALTNHSLGPKSLCQVLLLEGSSLQHFPLVTLV